MTNPLLQPSPLPYGLPPFSEIRVEHYRPAFEAGAAEQLAEVAAIVADPADPTFANSVEALERSGRLLERVLSVFFNLASSDGTAEMLALEEELSPAYAAHRDALLLDPGLFARVDAVHAGRHESGLDAEQVRLVERYHRDFVLAGAHLDEAGRTRLKEINQRVAALGARFTSNLVKDTEERALVLDSAEQLAGASPDEVAAAAAAATARGLEGRYVVTLGLPTNQPLLASLTDRDVRRRLFEASVGRCSEGEHDNAPLARELATLRAEAAQLLGFDTHADQIAFDQTAGTVAAVDEMLTQLVAPAMANLAAEQAELEELARQDGLSLEPWDWAFYSARVARERYHVDGTALRPWFALDRVLHDGVFYAANQLYGLTFTERKDLPGYHPEVRVFEVHEEDGTPVGL